VEEGQVAAVDARAVPRHLVGARRLLHAPREVVVADVQAGLLDLLPQVLHRVEVLLARHVLVAERLPVPAQLGAQRGVDADRALDRERHVDLRVHAQPLARRVELADLAQHAGVHRALALDRARALERDLVGAGGGAQRAQRLVGQARLRQQPARDLVLLAGLEQRQREGEAAAVRLGAVQALDDALQIGTRRRRGGDHVGIRADAVVVEHAYDRAQRIELAVDPLLLAAQHDQTRDVLVHVGQRRDEARVRRVTERQGIERRIGGLDRHHHREPEVEDLRHEVAGVAALERAVREDVVVPVAVLVPVEPVLELADGLGAGLERVGRSALQIQEQVGDRLAAGLILGVVALGLVRRERAEVVGHVAVERDTRLVAVALQPLAQRPGVGRRVDVGVVEIAGPDL